MEDALLRDQIERYNQRLREFEERQRTYRSSTLSTHERGGTGGNGNGGTGAGSGSSHGQPLEVSIILCTFLVS